MFTFKMQFVSSFRSEESVTATFKFLL